MEHPVRSLRWRLAQWLELRWWQRYLGKKSAEAYRADKLAYWARLLQQLEWQVIEGASVLDAGCGPAGMYMYLHDKQRVTAIDPLLSHYDGLEVFERTRYPTVSFQQVALEGYHAPKPFDAIYCLNAINHVRDWSRSLDVLTAAARSGTRLLLTSDVHRHAWLQPLFRTLPGDALHPQQHRAGAYHRALQERGWRIERETVLRTEFIFEYRAWVCTLTPVPPRLKRAKRLRNPGLSVPIHLSQKVK